MKSVWVWVFALSLLLAYLLGYNRGYSWGYFDAVDQCVDALRSVNPPKNVGNYL
jgi:hypothetical protein